MSVVITLDRVSKRFTLQHHKARSFQEALVNFVHRRNGTVEQFWALKDVSFDVQSGQTLGIIGENGSGKSTILKLITRILEPTEGKVSVQGRVSALIELGAGFHPDLTGRENIYLNGSILGFSRKEMSRKFDEIVTFSELERFIDTPVKHYSSGMYARLGFSVAISVDPDILIIDEVLAVGDEAFQRKCLDRISAFRRRGKTILFVSHNLGVIEQLCDRVVWMAHGEVQDQGPAARVLRSYLAALQKHDEENRELARQATGTAYEADAEGSGAKDAGSVRILGAELLSAEHVEKYSFSSGESFIVRLHYRIADPATDLVAGLELRRSDGLLIHRSSRRLAYPLSTDANGRGSIELEIESLPLLAGTYEVVPILCPVDAPPTPRPGTPCCSFSVWSDEGQDGIVALPVGSAAVGDRYLRVAL
jgi:ABC-type polysaccharide/polyol phosphate transport system ATPase subunit